MSVQLLDYQETGVRFLSSRSRAYLADDAGLGKTIQALEAMRRIVHGGRRPDRWVVCCPASVALNWLHEAGRVLPLNWARILVRDPTDLPDPLTAKGSWLLVLTYGRVSTREDIVGGLRDLARRVPLGLVLDEAHFLKNLDTGRTKALLGLTGLQVECSRVWCLSATPMPNNVAEMYPAIRTLCPKAITVGPGLHAKMMSQHEFMDYFTHWSQGTYGPKIHGNRKDRIKVLRSALSDTFLRRKKADVLSELPPIRWSDLTVDFDEKKGLQVLDYLSCTFTQSDLDDRELVQRALANPNVAQALHALGLLKVPGAVEYVADRLGDNADKLILFAHHQQVIAELTDKLSGYLPAVIDGSKSAQERHGAVQRFQADPTCRVFIGQNTAAGTGITLTAASEVLLVEPSWVPADNYQIASRAHRIGQKGSVIARFVALNGGHGWDAAIQETLRRKTQMIAEVFD